MEQKGLVERQKVSFDARLKKLVLTEDAEAISKLFEKDIKSVLIFGSVPIIYYLFDYIMGIYTDLWKTFLR